MIGLLKGGHIFVYDVCKDDLWLVRGKPEFNQLNHINKNDELHTTENEMAPVNQAEKETCKQSNNIDFPWKRAFFQQSLKVITSILEGCVKFRINACIK